MRNMRIGKYDECIRLAHANIIPCIGKLMGTDVLLFFCFLKRKEEDKTETNKKERPKIKKIKSSN